MGQPVGGAACSLGSVLAGLRARGAVGLPSSVLAEQFRGRVLVEQLAPQGARGAFGRWSGVLAEQLARGAARAPTYWLAE